MPKAFSRVDWVSEGYFPEEHPSFGGKIGFDFDGFMELMLKYQRPGRPIGTRIWCATPYVPYNPKAEQRRACMMYPWDEKKKKWDISQWTDEHCDIVTRRVNAMLDNGIPLVITMEEDCTMSPQSAWNKHPWKKDNNIQGWGANDCREGQWTGPDAGHANQYMTQFHFPNFIRLIECLKQKWVDELLKPNGMIKIELGNEPLIPDRIFAWLDFLEFWGVTRSNIASSVTPRNRKKCFFEPWPDSHDGSNTAFTTGCGIVNIHTCGSDVECKSILQGIPPGSGYPDRKDLTLFAQDGDYVTYVKNKYPHLTIVPDSDGNCMKDGTPAWQVAVDHVMSLMNGPKSAEQMVKRYGYCAYLAGENDYPLTREEYKKAFKRAEPYLKAIAGA